MTLGINRFNYNNFINIIAPVKAAPAFKGDYATSGVSDTFTGNSELNSYLSVSAINNMMLMNPKVGKILRENGVKQEINLKELNKLAQGHLKDTKTITVGILNNLSPEVAGSVDKQAVLQASLFHDFGKVLVPDAIVNKKGKLNDKEKSVMALHSELGYELLKTQNLSPKALELIKYHHQTPDNTGYPINTDGFEYGLEAEIVALADKYSALTEKRSYKSALTKDEALEIILDEHEPSVALDALVKFVKG